jgi:DNA-binding transcriptional LysR family regulator
LVFRTIVDTGTFSAAAEQLNKTVSSVSYTISKLEQQLQLTLFDRTQYRPTLTEFGREVYADAEQLLRRADRFAARTELRKNDHKTSIVISIDNIFPRAVLVKALNAFSEEFPTVSIHLCNRDFDRVTEDILSGFADMGLMRIDTGFSISGFDGVQIGSTQNMLVMAPEHPLAQGKATFSLAELEEHRQLILSRTPDTQNRIQAKLHKGESWTVPDDDTLRALLKQNLGWAYVNRHVVWKDLADGSLVAPKCSSVRESTINRLAVVWPVANPLSGPSLRLADLLRVHFPAAFPDGFYSQFNQWAEETP